MAKAQLHRSATSVPGCSVAHPVFVDAPVSGGVTGASAATLSFMVCLWLQHGAEVLAGGGSPFAGNTWLACLLDTSAQDSWFVALAGGRPFGCIT